MPVYGRPRGVDRNKFPVLSCCAPSRETNKANKSPMPSDKEVQSGRMVFIHWHADEKEWADDWSHVGTTGSQQGTSLSQVAGHGIGPQGLELQAEASSAALDSALRLASTIDHISSLCYGFDLHHHGPNKYSGIQAASHRCRC